MTFIHRNDGLFTPASKGVGETLPNLEAAALAAGNSADG